MLELTTTGRLVDYAVLEAGGLAAVLARRDLQAALESGGGAQLWLELGPAGEDGRDDARVTVDLQSSDLEEILSRSEEDEIALALDGDGLAAVLEDSDVEAHGLRGALAIAVTSAAVLAPTSMAAVPQTVESAVSAQRVSSAVTSQAVPATTAQVTPAAARTQVAKAQVVKGQLAKAQVSSNLVLKAHGLKIVRAGLVR
jgi:hypothetical protein